MTKPWLAIVGVGENGLAELTPEALALIDKADIFIGGERQLAMLKDDPRQRLKWLSPLKDTVQLIREMRGRKVCVLATGDPMHYGIGVTLCREFGKEAVHVVPNLSAFTLACARLGWPLAEVETITLHGRPLDLLRRSIRHHARLLILSDDGSTPKQVARLLRQSGYGLSRMTVFEHMGGPSEKRYDGLSKSWRRRTKDFNTIAIECIRDATEQHPQHTIGLPDEAFVHDGQITKQDIRALTIAALAPGPGELLWDVGAGCGSVVIEWLLQQSTAKAIAIEENSARATLIAENAQNLGVPNLQIITGTAPAALKGLAKPQAIFIGGGVTDAKLLSACWRALPNGGRLLANVVTTEGEAALLKFHSRHGGELSRHSVAKLQPLGNFHAWQQMRPVVQYRGIKT